MRLSRPQRYDGRGDAQVLDDFVAGLRTYLHFYTESEATMWIQNSSINGS